MGGCISRLPIQGRNSFRSQGGLTEPSSPRSSDYAGGQVTDSNSLDGRCSTVSDIEDVTKARTCSGLESSNLIVGLDVTKSNEWTGKCKRNVHQTGDVQTPYEQALPIVQNTLVSFDEENIIPGSEAAIMGFPSRSNATSISGGQSGHSGHFPQRDPLPPPDHGESSSVTSYANQDCIICTDPKDLALGCGHQICGKCAQRLYSCPICRRRIHTRVKLSGGSDQIWCPLCPTNQCNPKDMAFDCGHQTCSKCGESLQCCPKCHKTIKTKIKLY